MKDVVSNTAHIKTHKIISVVVQNVNVFWELCGALGLLPDTDVGFGSLSGMDVSNIDVG